MFLNIGVGLAGRSEGMATSNTKWPDGAGQGGAGWGGAGQSGAGRNCLVTGLSRIPIKEWDGVIPIIKGPPLGFQETH